jgi:23S rRNA (guanine745-N1)-methyltransferase
VAPLLPRPGHRLLRCPICRLDLDAEAGALCCRNRHSFDLARDGYVNLLSGRRRQPSEGGDRSEQLRHRAAFLDAGHFGFVAASIAAQLREAAALPADGRWRVLDPGCGTGHHLARIAAELGSGTIGLGLDIAAAAVRLAARRWPELAFAVANVWAHWPVRDAAFDLVLSIFAPKNFAETALALRPGGWLALAYPGPDHLVELRRRYPLLRQHEDKSRCYAENAMRLIGQPIAARLVRRASLDARTVRDLVMMGPSARNIPAPAFSGSTEPVDVTFDIEVLLARKPAENLSPRHKGRRRLLAP